MLTWEQYRRRRRINVKKWLAVNNINSYEKLVDICLSRGVKPPPLKEVVHFFGDSDEPQRPAVQFVPKPVKPVSEKASPLSTKEAIEPEDDEPNEDPADLGVYDINDEGFLIVRKERIRSGLKRK